MTAGPDIRYLLRGQRGQDGLAHTGAVQRAAQAHPAGHPHGTVFGLIDIDNILPVPDDQMHRLAGSLGQPLQMGFGHPHDVHTVDDAAGQLEHFQRQAVAAGLPVLHGIPQRHQAGQQPVHRAFGQFRFLGQPLQAGPCRVCRQPLDQRKNALHALYTAFIRHRATSFQNLTIYSYFGNFRTGRSTVPHYGTIITRIADFCKGYAESRNPQRLPQKMRADRCIFCPIDAKRPAGYN